VGARASYPPGTFCWVDLATTDAAAAKRFYRELFGWDAPAGWRYAHWTLDGRDVAGVYELDRVEPHWTSYVAVADADAVAARAAELGGSVIEPVVVVGADGRRAVLADPIGAIVALWQAGSHPGARLVNDVGCWCSNQLQARDPGAAVPFYRDLLGWDVVEEPGSVPPYWNIRNRGRDNGGMVGDEEGPAAWVVYFHVANADATARAVEGAGGAVRFAPTTIGLGRLAVCADPQDAVFGVFAGRTDP
jgi:predicted enzyme related to lactoylglutathione lyase